MTDFENFESRIIYEVDGWVDEDVNTDNFTRATMASLTTEARLTWDETLKANIINLDSWFKANWREKFTKEIELDGREFLTDYSDAEVILDLRKDEVIEAAEKRAAEDYTEAAYVLGAWVNRAREAPHIVNVGILRKAYDEVAERDEQPDDSTTADYRGGA